MGGRDDEEYSGLRVRTPATSAIVHGVRERIQLAAKDALECALQVMRAKDGYKETAPLDNSSGVLEDVSGDAHVAKITTVALLPQLIKNGETSQRLQQIKRRAEV
ncbi:hypothetical protein GN244_ATG13747 [Phytophthora infestans]|uniref:Uncharacterized protein n=1 Tax=Phytophthora infestans TaxID=4787 RepID=A0A833SKQ7_PHYIN|nr:hypothetical protein GN244_ATG13747 [Phytophthora infestans]